MEMIAYVEAMYPGASKSTFFESCGVADLITTCYGGRNRRVCEAFAKTGKASAGRRAASRRRRFAEYRSTRKGTSQRPERAGPADCRRAFRDAREEAADEQISSLCRRAQNLPADDAGERAH